MSVILKRNNKIILYCKGADNVIYDRLGSNQNDVKNRTQEHLNVNICHPSHDNNFFKNKNTFVYRNLPVRVSELWFWQKEQLTNSFLIDGDESIRKQQ